MAEARAVDDEFGAGDEVTQLDQIWGDLVLGVVVVDLLFEQAHAFFGLLQPFVAAHDADVVPHGLAQGVPRVGNHHGFVRRDDARGIPFEQIGRFVGEVFGGDFFDVIRYGFAHDHAFEQGVGGEAIRTMQAGVGDFADGVEVLDVGAPRQIGRDTAAGVVRTRRNRNRLLRHVDAEFQTFGIDVREVFVQKLCGQMRHVEVDAFNAVFLHLKVNRTRDDVTRRQLATLVMVEHETVAGLSVFARQAQNAAFATQRFGNQE